MGATRRPAATSFGRPTRSWSAATFSKHSEKAWEAQQCTPSESISEQRGWEHDSITHLFIAARWISEETGDNHIDTLFSLTYGLHINSKEGWMDDGTVVDNVGEVKLLLDKLEKAC